MSKIGIKLKVKVKVINRLEFKPTNFETAEKMKERRKDKTKSIYTQGLQIQNK